MFLQVPWNGAAPFPSVRHIKLTSAVCSINAVEAAAIQINKTSCLMSTAGTAAIRFAPAQEFFLALSETVQPMGNRFMTIFNVSVSLNQLAVDVAEYGLLRPQRKKQARRPSEWLYVPPMAVGIKIL
jgi:hypothetical protein